MKLSTVVSIVLATSLSFAQAPAPLPSFEVASVKAVAGRPSGFSAEPQQTGGRITWTTTPDLLVQYAFHAPAWRISGMGKGMTFVRIEATLDPSATQDQVRLMVQSLLKDRFRFAFHRETKEQQGYVLQIAKSGSKLQTRTPQGSIPSMPPYFAGKPADMLAGRIIVTMEGPGSLAMTGRGVTVSVVAESIADTIGAFVLDQTGLTGNYYFGFRFTNPDTPLVPGVDTAPIATAVQEELGLKLEKQKGPVEIIVVDRFAPPSEN